MTSEASADRLYSSEQSNSAQTKSETKEFWPFVLFAGRLFTFVFLVCLSGLLGYAKLEDNWHKSARFENAIDHVRVAWQAGVSASSLVDAEATSQLGKQFILHDIILGGAVYGPTGDLLASFGQQPVLTWDDVHFREEQYRHFEADMVIDVGYLPTETGLTYEVIARIPGPGHPLARIRLEGHASYAVGAIIAMAAIMAAIFTGVLVLVLFPSIVRLQRAAIQAAGAKTGVDRFRLRWKRRDLMGVTARSIDTLIARLHYQRENEISPILRSQERAQIAIVRFNGHGRLLKANHAAALLMGVENALDLSGRDFTLSTVPGGKSGHPVTLAESEFNGAYTGCVSLVSQDGQTLFCYADIASTGTSDAPAAGGVILILVDLTEFFTELVKLQGREETLDSEVVSLKRDTLTLKRQVDALKLMSKTTEQQPDDDSGTLFVSVEQIVNEWYRESRAAGTAQGTLEHSALDTVEGYPDRIRNVFHNAYSLLYLTCGDTAPRYDISSALVGDSMVEFELSCMKSKRSKPFEDSVDDADMEVFRNAFIKALELSRGEVTSESLMRNDASITFTLPAFVRHKKAPKNAA